MSAATGRPAKTHAPAASDAQWPMAAKNWQNTRFSELNQITPANAGRLRLAWTFSTGVKKGQEAAPIVVGNTMYVVTPYPNILYALDLTKAGTPGVLKWKYVPPTIPAAQGVACCDVVNRGAVYADGKVIINTLDGQTIAVDAASGRELWKTRVGNIHIGETITMSPLVVRDKVFVGNSGGELGVRGWIKALAVSNGRLLWTAYSTGPDSAVKIGPRFRAFYPSEKGKDLGVHTWPPGQWEIGGGNVWGWVSYDPDLNLIYHGTGNPGVWNPDLRPGDNKWTCGLFARDADTGEARWFYQWTPHDLFDHDGVNENVLVDLPLGRSVRKVLLSAQRDGYLYVLDRASGQVLSATPFVRVTAYKGVDLKSGRIQPNEAKETHTGVVVRDIAPASPGGKDWQPTAWSPRTRLLYIPHQTLAMDYEGTDANYIEGTPYVGADVKMYPDPVRPGDGSRGAFTAWDPVRARPVWEIKEPFPVWSGTVVTAGDVAFYGTMDGWFKAVDARTGRVLWRHKTDSGIIGQPVTYRGPDGKQYVAVLAGVGGWSGAIVSGPIDPRDRGAALGFVNAMTDLPKATPAGDKLYVFALP
ncbi:MAG TPA: PQQ-dependent dehydrogenase, methanol/ethanol family [Candidatus Eisenbacteria bacterium]|nr:PQQ-dependent dehydrogenase, methanol/ethanol family [Candidatus Eisenbacteria bacterium]